MAARYVVGYDIGGTKLGIGLSTVDGELIQSVEIVVTGDDSVVE